jgi:lipoyl synthase
MGTCDHYSRAATRIVAATHHSLYGAWGNLSPAPAILPEPMTDPKPLEAPSRRTPETHRRGVAKLARIPVKVQAGARSAPKPAWIRAKSPSGPAVARIKRILRAQGLASVCEEAACPNLGECFSHGAATFMIRGDLCTRRCPFCDVAHGRPAPLDPQEPVHLARAVRDMGLRYLVITSVDRDDLRDAGAAHFAACVREVRAHHPGIRVEILVPDFRGRQGAALEALVADPPDVFNRLPVRVWNTRIA